MTIAVVDAADDPNAEADLAVYRKEYNLPPCTTDNGCFRNSYGGPEGQGGAASDKRYFNHPGVLVTASTGDSGYGGEYPAASPKVLAVGGTRLVRSSSGRGWAEAAWTGSGGGCSERSRKPTWQSDEGCANRTVADLAAVADPDTGMAIYDSYGSAHGWLVAGGTSASAQYAEANVGHLTERPSLPKRARKRVSSEVCNPSVT
jgi:subtilase family serine protease